VRRLFKKKGFLCNRGGLTGVEFALISPVLFLIIFTTIELGYLFYLRSAVEGATQQVARRAITGAQTGETATNRDTFFLQMVRTEIGRFLPPNTTLTVETRVWNTLAQVGGDSQVNNATGVGRAGQILQYRVQCTYKFIVPVVGWLTGSTRTNLGFSATAFVKNEINAD
jgi:Flp pilus assembly protein TadG